VSFRRVVHGLVGSSLLIFVVSVVLAPGSSTLAASAPAPEIKQHLSCAYSSDDSLDSRYDIYWDPQPNDGDVRITTASRGTIVGYEFDGFGHSVRESVPGSTAGPITITITGTFTDPDSQVRVPFTTTVTIVLNADCVAHRPDNVPYGVGFEVEVSLYCSGEETDYYIGWQLTSNEPGVGVNVESATVGGIYQRFDSVSHWEPLSSTGTISNTIAGYRYEADNVVVKTMFEITLVASLVEPCRAPAIPVGCIGAPSTPLAHKTGLVDPTTGTWHLYDCAAGEMESFVFGNPGDYPFMGDWDCDGVDTPGLYRQSDGYAYLRNSNTQGNADITFYFGNPGDIPIAGDFDADGCDTLSIYRPSNQTVYIINESGTNDGGLGAADYSFVFGNPGDKPFVGDFNGNGQDTVGLHRESTGLVYYRNTNTTGNADNEFIFGNPGDRFVAGDWTGNAVSTPSVFRPSNTTTYFRHTNSSANADFEFIAGQPTWLPVSGNTAAP
jgi:hypothetical protein